MDVEITTLGGGKTTFTDEQVAEWRMGFRGPLITPEDGGYEQARMVENRAIDRRPGLIVRCSGTADVIDAVNLAREHELLVAVRGGGHHVAGHGTTDGGLVIDLSAMTAVRVDPDQRRVDVQGGATWGDVDRETQAFGLAVPGGIISTTGVGGLTLGGGIGWLHRKWGLTCELRDPRLRRGCRRAGGCGAWTAGTNPRGSAATRRLRRGSTDRCPRSPRRERWEEPPAFPPRPSCLPVACRVLDQQYRCA